MAERRPGPPMAQLFSPTPVAPSQEDVKRAAFLYVEEHLCKPGNIKAIKSKGHCLVESGAISAPNLLFINTEPREGIGHIQTSPPLHEWNGGFCRSGARGDLLLLIIGTCLPPKPCAAGRTEHVDQTPWREH